VIAVRHARHTWWNEGVTVDSEASFGAWIKQRRRKLRLTQQALAGEVGCSAELIRKIEADARRPSRVVAERLARFLGVPEQQHAVFVKVARAELRTDWLPPPDQFADPLATAITAMRPSNLPVSLTSLIGRAADRQALCATLLRSDVRLLTLTGPPGIGKTRLAIQAAADLSHMLCRAGAGGRSSRGCRHDRVGAGYAAERRASDQCLLERLLAPQAAAAGTR
jgi:transcriptional regulator with XRE-family HTH domain